MHVFQFSWAAPREVARLKSLAEDAKVSYQHHPVNRKGPIGLGLTLWRGIHALKSYLKEQGISVVMPRSTNPAIMVNYLYPWLRRRRVKIVFDADGFPLQERVDFLGRDPEGLLLSWLKRQEATCLRNADKVLTRSEKAIDIHLMALGNSERSKFQVVPNGRNPAFFLRDENKRVHFRSLLGIAEGEILWVYSGTLGPEYELADMLSLFEAFHANRPGSRFLILTRNIEFFNTVTGNRIPKGVMVKETSFDDIPGYLSAADVALSLRKPAKSLAGLAPVKLGEYLMMGLPVVVSAGIGDTEALLADSPFCFLYDKENCDRNTLYEWISEANGLSRSEIREFAIHHFGLSASVDAYLTALRDVL